MNYSKLRIKFKVCYKIACLKISKRNKEKQVLLGLQNIFYSSQLTQKFMEYGITARVLFLPQLFVHPSIWCNYFIEDSLYTWWGWCHLPSSRLIWIHHANISVFEWQVTLILLIDFLVCWNQSGIFSFWTPSMGFIKIYILLSTLQSPSSPYHKFSTHCFYPCIPLVLFTSCSLFPILPVCFWNPKLTFCHLDLLSHWEIRVLISTLFPRK